jgi:hypothetical protein
MDSRYSECLGWFYRRYPDKIKDYIQSVSPKQIACKQWLVNELLEIPREFNNIQLFGGWFGYPLIDMLNNSYKIKSLTNIDCDKFATSVCFNFKNYFNHDFVKTSTRDLVTTGGIYKEVDLVINTSSEHMSNLPDLIKNKEYSESCIFALQSNNMFDIEDHTNCVQSKEELAEKSGLNNILYSGKLDLDNYERYMVIGLF